MAARKCKIIHVAHNIFLLDSATLKSLRKRASENQVGGFPGGAVVESLPANAGDTGSSPGLGRSHMPRSN